ncbi:hypothetical protein [Actinocorallia libanotica]|uniref:Uncharacterized protein n=1 Tax=Actinocorallia libanotica TaxID=46162 RepID=A0ABN1S0B6_9ACTN
MSLQAELDQAVDAAARAQLNLCGLLAAHGIPGIAELRLLLAWPAGMRDAYNGWMAAMVTVVNALGHVEGIRDMSALSEKDKTLLMVRAYERVMSSPSPASTRMAAAAARAGM